MAIFAADQKTEGVRGARVVNVTYTHLYKCIHAMVSRTPVYPQGLSEYEDKENLDGGNCTWMDETFVDGTVSGLQKMLEVKNCAGCQPPVNLPTHFLVHCPLIFHFFCLTLLIVEKLSARYFFCHTLLIVEYLSCEVAVKLHWREGTAGKRNVHH